MSNKITEKQLQEWEDQYGDFYELPVGDKVCYLRVPTMLDFKRGLKALGEDTEIAFAEEMFKALWLGGDEEIRANDDYFHSARKVLKNLLEFDDAVVTDLPASKKQITIQGATCVVRAITRQDLQRAERANPGSKVFVTQEKLFSFVCIEKEEAFNDRNNAEIRFPLYKALEDMQNTKHATLKKRSRKQS